MSVAARDVVQEVVEQAARAAVQSGRLPGETLPLPPYVVDRPREERHGDYSVNVALLLARRLRMGAREVAEALRESMAPHPFVADAQVAGPGFLNIFLSDVWAHTCLSWVLREGESFGDQPPGSRERVLLEFVSANPTGPLNVVNARAAAVGDALARVMEAAGYTVHREFYVNDAGEQVRKLGMSVEARMREERGEQASIPEGGYPGEYVRDIARQWLAERGDAILAEDPEVRAEELGAYAVERILESQKEDLEAYGVHFDEFFRESGLHRTGQVQEVVRWLAEKGMTYEEDGAVWLAARRFGTEKDEVLRKQNGAPTYYAADIAYHRNKYARGYTRLIDILGPDHHGHIPRLKAAVQALGQDPDTLECLVVQQVRLLRGGTAVKMSKRGGAFVSMRELVEEVGKDAARFFFVLRSAETHLDFDLDLARLETQENPVFYVQYAHARIHSILRQTPPVEGPTDLSPLVSREEFELIRELGEFPYVVESAALAREPHRVTYYAQQVASRFHTFYNRHRVLGQEPEVTRARLALIRATATVLRRCLGLLGVSAPERM